MKIETFYIWYFYTGHPEIILLKKFLDQDFRMCPNKALCIPTLSPFYSESDKNENIKDFNSHQNSFPVKFKFLKVKDSKFNNQTGFFIFLFLTHAKISKSRNLNVCLITQYFMKVWRLGRKKLMQIQIYGKYHHHNRRSHSSR